MARRRSPDKESAGDLGELLQPESFEQRLERQIFAERHQMHLVVDAADRAVGIDHVDRIIGARRARSATASAARTAPVISSVPGLQQAGDLRQRVRLARQEKRKGRFRPDQDA